MRTIVITAASLVSLIALGGPSHAVLQIAGDISGSTFFCQDNTACDLNPLLGTLSLGDQVINGVAVNGSIQTSTKTAETNILNTSSLSLINTTTTSRDVTFTVSDTSYQGPVTGFASAGSGTWQNAAGSSLTLGWYNDPNNVQGANFAGDVAGVLVDSFFDLAVGPADAFSTSDSGAAVDPGLFSMTINATGTLVAEGQLINRGQTEIKDVQAAVVSEPGSLALLGGALLGLGLLRRRLLP